MRLAKMLRALEGKSLLAVLSLGLLFALGTAPKLNAQILYGSIVGSVKDPSGAAVPGATVTATQTQTQLTRSVTSDQAGGFEMSTLSAGNYTLKVSAQGFKTFTQTGVEVSINTITRADATLELGAVNQSVEVSASAAVLQTERPDVHHDLTATTIENVPMPPGNNFEQLFRAIPGVNPPVSAHSVATNPSRSLQYNSNGTSSYGNDVRVDGISQYNIWVPENAAYIPSSDAIEVVNVATNSYNPEQGLAGGSSVNVQIKNGTNQLHGDVYEYHYDNGLEARGFFDPRNGISRVPKDIFNQFGGSIGGPIKKDKVFFFGNVEATRQRQFANQLATVPTMAMRNGDLRGLDLSKANPDFIYDPATGNINPKTGFSDGTGRAQLSCGGIADVICANRISPTAAKILSLLPPPNIPDQSSNGTGPRDNFLGAADVVFNRLTSDSKIDWNKSDKFTMFGHLGLAKYNTLNPQIFGAIGGPQVSGFIGNEGQAYGHTYSFSVTGNYVATPNFIIDGSVGMTRMVANSAQLDVAKKEGTDVLGIPGVNGTRPFEGSWPEFDIATGQGPDPASGAFSNLGTQHNFMPYFRNDPQYDFTANATWIHANHSIRWGADLIGQHLNQQQPEWNSGGGSYGPQGGFQFQSGPTQCVSSVTSTTPSISNCFNGGSTTPLAKGKTASSDNYNGMASFLLGVDTGYGKNIQIPDYFHTITHEYSAYVGDQWRTTSKLTTTLGVRWEYFPMPTRGGSRGLEHFDFATGEMELCGVGGNPTDCGISVSKTNFSPRIGLAYRARNSFVMRAAYGITSEPYNVVDSLRTNFPILIPLFYTAPSLLGAGALDATGVANEPVGQSLPIGIPALPTPCQTCAEDPIPGNVSLATAPTNFKRGYIQSWNVTLEKELPGGWLASAGYVASRTIRQLGILNLNVGSPILPAGCIPGSTGATACGGNASLPFDYNNASTTPSAACPNGLASTQPGCRTAGMGDVTAITNNHYDSLQTSLSHHFANGYQVQFNYTWSKAIGMANVENEKGNPYIQTLSFYNLNRGLAPINRPQNFEAIFVAESPFGAKKHWVNSGVGAKILGGWQISGLVSAVSGSVVALSANGSGLNSSGDTQRPDIVSLNNAFPHAVGPGQQWFNTSAFAGVDSNPVANAQRFGTSAFYQFQGPGYFDMDLGLIRNFKLSERFNFQVRGQAVNFTNTPYFNNPGGNCGSYQSATATAPALSCNNGSFGQVTGINALARDGIGQRQFMISMKLSF